MKQHCNPLIPMGAITGHPTKAETDWMLEFYHSIGIDQYLIYPRSGCELEYLSEDWFEVCGNVIRKAAELGMKIFLYDDFNWPSAQINGHLVLDHPEFAQKQLRITHRENGSDYQIYDTALRLPKEEMQNSNQKWHDPVFFPLPKTDLLNPEMTKEFIRRTHEEYYKRFAPYFGSTIVAIFTDEPCYTYTCDLPNLPYYDDAPAEYFALYRKDLFEDLAQTTNATRPEFYDRYYTMLGKRFRTAFLDPITEWCTAHGIFSTGHLLGEEDATLRLNGNILHALSGLSLPGMDEIWTRTTFETAEVLTLCIIEYASRRRGGALAELYALGPCDMTHSTMRKMMAITALHGVDHYVLAVSAFDARGNYYKDGYYNPHNYTQPWAEAYRLLGKEATLFAEYARKTPVPQVELVYSASFCHRHIGGPKDVPGQAIHSLIRTIERNQWNLAFLDDTDTPTAPAVIRMVEEGFSVNGGTPVSVEEIPAQLSAILSRTVSVTDETGAILPDILLKSYPDGFAFVAMRDTGGECPAFVHVGNSVTEIRLTPGAFVCDRTLSPYCAPVSEIPLTNLSFTLTADHPNLLRAFALPDGFSFTADAELSGLRLLRRWYHAEETQVFLDGHELPVDPNADVPLMHGIAPLYTASVPFTLSAGTHTLTYSGKAEERRFLPLALLSGNFSLNGNTVSGTLPTTVSLGDLGEFLPDYTGKLTLTTEIAVPDSENALSLQIDSFGLFTRVTIDGTVSECAWEPFRYPIPESAKGKTVPVTVELFSSIRPMFGNPEEYPDLFPQLAWLRDVHDRVVVGTHTPIGIREIFLVAGKRR